MVHGMGRTPLSTWGLARYLARSGHTSEHFWYVAAFESFAGIRRRLRRRLERIAPRGPYAVLGHSLGGLLLRDALHGLNPQPRHFVMLATPNRSPRLAHRFRRFWFLRLFGGEPGQLLSDPAFYAKLPVPSVPYTIIAGTAGPRGRWSPFGDEVNDWIVALSETRISDRDEPVLVSVEHSFIMYHAETRAAVARALATA